MRVLLKKYFTGVGWLWVIGSFNQCLWDITWELGHKWLCCLVFIQRGICSFYFCVMQIGRGKSDIVLRFFIFMLTFVIQKWAWRFFIFQNLKPDFCFLFSDFSWIFKLTIFEECWAGSSRGWNRLHWLFARSASCTSVTTFDVVYGICGEKCVSYRTQYSYVLIKSMLNWEFSKNVMTYCRSKKNGKTNSSVI